MSERSSSNGVAAREGGVFRRSIAVDQTAIGQALQRFLYVRHRENVPSREKLANVRQ